MPWKCPGHGLGASPGHPGRPVGDLIPVKIHTQHGQTGRFRGTNGTYLQDGSKPDTEVSRQMSSCLFV